MIQDNTNNKEYWKNYTQYWKERVETTNNRITQKDKTASDDIIGSQLDLLDVLPEEDFLDYGCGFCRLYPYYQKVTGYKSAHYYGCEISETTLNVAFRQYPELKERCVVFDGRRTPYSDNRFDKIICYGVFDACDQENTIIELLRILRVGGNCCLPVKI